MEDISRWDTSTTPIVMNDWNMSGTEVSLCADCASGTEEGTFPSEWDYVALDPDMDPESTVCEFCGTATATYSGLAYSY